MFPPKKIGCQNHLTFLIFFYRGKQQKFPKYNKSNKERTCTDDAVPRGTENVFLSKKMGPFVSLKRFMVWQSSWVDGPQDTTDDPLPRGGGVWTPGSNLFMVFILTCKFIFFIFEKKI